jgi:septum site-determining protein MinD
VIAIAGGKGGTGKTTTAVALARALANDRRRRPDSPGWSDANAVGRSAAVVLVDGDVDMPDVHSMVGVSRSPTVVERPRGIAVPWLGGVRVAPPPRGANAGDLTETLRSLRTDRAERVLVDGPAGAGPDACRPLAVADAAVLVTRPSPQAVRDTAKTAAIAGRLETPVLAVAVVADTATGDDKGSAASVPVNGLRHVFDVESVVVVPRVPDDPLDDEQVSAAVQRLARACAGANTFLGGDE